MTITVLIHRQTEKERLPGTLRAWVKHNGRKAPKNLLAGHQFSRVDSAICEIDGMILDAFSGDGKLVLGKPEVIYKLGEGAGDDPLEPGKRI